MTRAEKARKIAGILRTLYPEPPIPLDHVDPFLGYLTGLHRPVLVDEHRVSRYHEQSGKLGKIRNQVFRHTVGKVILLLVFAHVGKRQDRQ